MQTINKIIELLDSLYGEYRSDNNVHEVIYIIPNSNCEEIRKHLESTAKENKITDNISLYLLVMKYNNNTQIRVQR